MNGSKMIQRLYLVTLALLVVHEIDSAYWKEWELFGLPGGIGLFLVLNLALVLAFLVGFDRIVRDSEAGLGFAVVLALLGIGAFVIHLAFLAAGHEQFRAPVSLAILGLTLSCSLGLGMTVLRVIRARRNSRRGEEAT